MWPQQRHCLNSAVPAVQERTSRNTKATVGRGACGHKNVLVATRLYPVQVRGIPEFGAVPQRSSRNTKATVGRAEWGHCSVLASTRLYPIQVRGIREFAAVPQRSFSNTKETVGWTAASLHQLGSTQYKLEEYQNALHSHKEVPTKATVWQQYASTAASLDALGCTKYQLEDYQNSLLSHKENLTTLQC